MWPSYQIEFTKKSRHLSFPQNNLSFRLNQAKQTLPHLPIATEMTYLADKNIGSFDIAMKNILGMQVIETAKNFSQNRGDINLLKRT